MYIYQVTVSRAASVRQALVGNFISAQEQCLIICKSTRIEVCQMTSEGLMPLLELPIYGRIATMELFRPKSEEKDMLFFTTEDFCFCVVAYDAEKGSIVTRAKGCIRDRNGFLAEIGNMSVIDPESRMIGLHFYEGLFKVIPIDGRGHLQQAYNIRMEELRVLDIEFLHGYSRPTIVILYLDQREMRHVKTYEISLGDKEFSEGPWSLPNVEAGASILISLPLPLGGVVIVGEQSIIYYNGANTKSLAMKQSVIKAWGAIDAMYQRILLGDFLGRLWLLVLIVEDDVVSDLKLELLTETSCASVILYLDNGVVFIGSASGDSQLIKLDAVKDPDLGYVQLLETYTNLGPIVDLSVVSGKQGRTQIVSCSGIFKDGSLRVIRSGIGVNEHAQLDMPSIRGLWSFRAASGRHEKYVVIAYIGETKVLGVLGEVLEEALLPGFDHAQQTIYAGCVEGRRCDGDGRDRLLQVTSRGMAIVDLSTGTRVAEWGPPEGSLINVCAVNASRIAVGMGATLVLLEVEDGYNIIEKSRKLLDHEIACMSIGLLGGAAASSECKDDEFATSSLPLVSIGLWNDITIRILTVPNLDEVWREPLGGDILPRSVIMATFEGLHYLFAALGDGHVFSFSLSPPGSGSAVLTNRKKISLGAHPVTLSMFTSRGASHVFACSDRPTVIYSRNKKISYSNVNLKEVNCVTAVDSRSFPDSLAFSTDDSLVIGTIDEIQKLHIRTVPLNEMVRRICHQSSTHTFLLSTVRYECDENTGEEMEWHALKLVDDRQFELLDVIKLERNELGESMVSVTFANCNHPHYAVGTGYAIPNESEPTKGRILILRVEGHKLFLESETSTDGAVYCMDAFNGKLLTGISSKVVLFTWSHTSEGVKDLKIECEHGNHVQVLCITSKGDLILAGDLMRSVVALAYRPVDGRIEQLASDPRPHWITALTILDDSNYLASENYLNLLAFNYRSTASSEDERERLALAGCYYLGDQPNVFRHGSITMKLPDSDSLDLPTVIYGTVSGSIGIIAVLPEHLFLTLQELQNGINAVVRGIGGLSHDEWRSFKTDRKTQKSFNFIDGDLIESVLDLSKEDQERIAQVLHTDVDTMIQKIEMISQATH